MSELNGYQILIVESFATDSSQLRNVMLSHGAHVHVFNNATSALVMARQKRIDAAFIQYDDCTNQELCAYLSQLSVPVIFTATDARKVAEQLIDLVPPFGTAA